jgi:hypothetical protein
VKDTDGIALQLANLDAGWLGLVGVRLLPVCNHGILPSLLMAAWRRAGHGHIEAGARDDLHAWAVAELAPIALRAALPFRLQAGTLPGEPGSARTHNAAEPTGINPDVALLNVGGDVLSHPFPLDVGFGSSGISDSAHKAWQGVILLASRGIAEHAALSKLVGQVGISREAPDSRKGIGDGGQHQACSIKELVEIYTRELIGDSLGRS